jgi:hypothetical protein
MTKTKVSRRRMRATALTTKRRNRLAFLGPLTRITRLLVLRQNRLGGAKRPVNTRENSDDQARAAPWARGNPLVKTAQAVFIVPFAESRPNVTFTIERGPGLATAPVRRASRNAKKTARATTVVPGASPDSAAEEVSTAKATAEAKDFLLRNLAAGPFPADRLKRKAQEAGIAERALEQAADALGVKRYRKPGMGAKAGWVWELPGVYGTVGDPGTHH